METVLLAVSGMAAVFSGITGLLSAKIWFRLGGLTSRAETDRETLRDHATRINRLEDRVAGMGG